jgi:peptidoglycan-N-acetylglucosamine deacetylase
MCKMTSMKINTCHIALYLASFFLIEIVQIQAEDSKQLPDLDYDYIPGQDIGFAQYLSKTLYGSGKIALTYDDGPHPVYTLKILDLLKKYNQKATFFVLGSNINSKTRSILKRIILEGHILATHDEDHQNNNNESQNNFYNDLKTSIEKVESLYKEVEQTYYNPHHYHQVTGGMYFRFPYGAYGKASSYHHMNSIKELSQELYQDNCIQFVFWDIDTVDWLKDMTSQNVFENVLAYLRGGTAYRHKKVSLNGKKKFVKQQFTIKNPIGGGVILMHDIHQKSIIATQKILEFIKNNHSFEIISLPEIQEFSFNLNTFCNFYAKSK